MMRIATLGLVLLLVSLAHARTTLTNETESKVSCRPAPQGRGTLGIIFSCLFTLILCIRTVIHRDVIEDGTPFSRLLTKVQWMLYAFLAPESVVISAYQQWNSARTLHAEFCRYHGIDRGDARDLLGIEGAFFVIMGCFSGMDLIEPSGEDFHLMHNYPNFQIGWCATRFMGIVRGVPRGSVPKAVNRRPITDRGKTDGIGKALALIQAFSIVFQYLFRKIQGLAVTLLEFHAVVQVLCAVLIYFFWWFKPQGVIEPIPIIDPPSTTEKGMLEVIEMTPNMNMRDRHDPEEALKKSIPSKVADGANTLPPPGGLFSRSTLAEIRDRLTAWAGDGVADSIFKLKTLSLGTNPVHSMTYSIYGAAHSIAWYSSFPTLIEQCLWRISCVSLVVTPFLSTALYRFPIRGSGRQSNVLAILAAITFAYTIICRAYLTIECFISLRLLPANAYDTVVFERNWPSL